MEVRVEAQVGGLTVFRPFLFGGFTAYGGGGLGYGHAETTQDSVKREGDGLLLEGGGGILFNRNSNVQLILDVRYVFGTFLATGCAPTHIRSQDPQAEIVVDGESLARSS